ncbi:MAG TPA: hypothetical protein PK095_23000, partial [Myxococcota bacterium]|nr:hypothetical protein [Myxococcota bacterium]
GAGGACFPPELLPEPEPEAGPEVSEDEPEPGPELDAEPEPEHQPDAGPDVGPDAEPSNEPAPSKSDSGCHGSGVFPHLLVLGALALTRLVRPPHRPRRSPARALPVNLRVR